MYHQSQFNPLQGKCSLSTRLIVKEWHPTGSCDSSASLQSVALWPRSTSPRHTLQLWSTVDCARTFPWSATSALILSNWTCISFISCTNCCRSSIVTVLDTWTGLLSLHHLSKSLGSRDLCGLLAWRSSGDMALSGKDLFMWPMIVRHVWSLGASPSTTHVSPSLCIHLLGVLTVIGSLGICNDPGWTLRPLSIHLTRRLDWMEMGDTRWHVHFTFYSFRWAHLIWNDSGCCH